ncbi:pectinesterase family protein [Aliifodinibius sp. S!AR15-10]|uniref:pectinesterase family protein n=1 Tax=Aliifodinibius sp. S!AR15-10 TaxID=2950437 RepID=UPI00285A368E|nr:pectinesterase family protein [Aliifodinibius sp. S!AR15-10]MDR8393334.1 pectinesterase family protein [Aliifodinibius sp. S!AR15-10]
MSSKVIGVFLLLLGVFAVGATAQDYETEFVVAKDGSGDFTSIQAAIDASKSFPYERITIQIKDGVYREKVKVHSWNTKLSLVGESKENTIITYDDYFDKIDRGRNSTFHTYTLLVDGNDFHAENLTIRNTAGPVGQAVALHVEADRASFESCRILGDQDTIYAAGEGDRQYFKECYIEGTTDFIFGEATAVFEDCTIHSKSNSYITAASTAKSVEHGFIFKNCRLTAAEDVTEVYLGRPWRNFARTVFLNCYMGDHIRPVGWNNWGKPEAEQTVFYGEYGNKGPGYQPGKRAEWTHILTPEQAKNYSLESVFGDWEITNR